MRWPLLRVAMACLTCCSLGALGVSSEPMVASSTAKGVSVVLVDGQLQKAEMRNPGALAYATFKDGALNPSNMGHLQVVTAHSQGSDLLKMKAAGWAEGYLTVDRIHQHFHNMWAFFNFTSTEPLQFLDQQRAWLRHQLSRPAPAGKVHYWEALKALMSQFEGLVEGYNAAVAQLSNVRPSSPRPLTEAQLYLLCSMADMSDIRAAVAHQHGSPRGQDGAQPDWDTLQPAEVRQELAAQDRCSVLVKVSPDLSDMWLGQVAWYTYAAMLRVFKHYDFSSLSNPGLVGRTMGFSSYYGQMSSDDDFYLIGSTKLTVLQTTNRILNDDLLDLIKPDSVLAWQRVRTANLLARTGQEWAKLVGQHNSGTYTNTWAVVSHGLFTPNMALPDGLLWVVEQAPGHMFDRDMTQMLDGGYFSLYNVPVFRETYDLLGYPDFITHQSARGAAYDAAIAGVKRQLAPRAKLFRRDHGSVRDLDSMKHLMRSNNWQTDPYSMNVSTNAICGRGDVDPEHPRASGCYDGKVSTWQMALALEAEVVNGPPFSPSMPPFRWIEPWREALRHDGQPGGFEFSWERFKPELSAQLAARMLKGEPGLTSSA